MIFIVIWRCKEKHFGKKYVLRGLTSISSKINKDNYFLAKLIQDKATHESYVAKVTWISSDMINLLMKIISVLFQE
jgi:hypothetical protein